MAEAGEKIPVSGAVEKLLARRGPRKGPVFATFSGGYAELYETLAEKSGASIHIDSFISELTPQMLEKYDRILLATPAPTTAILLRTVAPEASAELKKVELASSAVVGLKYQRVQFTNDMLPADLLGINVFQPNEGSFKFHPGPVFHQFVLADEINRASPKVQSALLEAMEERQVSVDGRTYRLPKPFLVVATQNPL